MTTPWPSDIAVCIPSYKSAALLPRLLPAVLEQVPATQIFVIDDASGDGTPEVVARFGIHCLVHHVNRGKGGALITGFHHCIGSGIPWVITMDADGQHSPDDLHKFAAAARQEPSPGICIGERSMQPGVMPPERILSNRLTSFILGLFADIRVADSQCGYRLYSMELIRCTDIAFRRFEMESEIILRAAYLGFPVTFIPIQTLYLKGPSHIAHVADTFRWIAAVAGIRLQKRRIIHHFQQKNARTGS